MTSSVSSLVSLVVALLVVALSSSLSCLAHQCGDQGGGASCAFGLCCSKWGWCGTSDDYCAPGNCQTQCPIRSPVPPPPPPTTPPVSPPPPVYDITDTVDWAMFDEMFPNRLIGRCANAGKIYFTYDNFVTAARSFPGFGTTGNNVTRKREVAAFLAQTGFETAFAPVPAYDEISEHGYCLVSHGASQGRPYCALPWPCPLGKWYYPRGPIMLAYNYNYIHAGEALGLDLFNDPNFLVRHPIAGFRAAIWFWMTEQFLKPSCHDVMTGKWTPSPEDLRAQRFSGYGLTTNIITSTFSKSDRECGYGQIKRVQDRINFYKRACNILRVDPGLNLDCFQQEPFKMIRPTLWNTE